MLSRCLKGGFDDPGVPGVPLPDVLPGVPNALMNPGDVVLLEGPADPDPERSFFNGVFSSDTDMMTVACRLWDYLSP